jgi:integrase
MATRAKLTKELVEREKAGAVDRFLWDSADTGFGLKLTPSGGKTFVYQYRAIVPGKAGTWARRYSIGPFGKLTVEQARKEAKRLGAIVALGGDPLADRDAKRAAQDEAIRKAERARLARTENLFEAQAPKFLDWYQFEPKAKGGYRSPSSVESARWIVRQHLRPAFNGKTLAEITALDAQKVLKAIPREQVATRRLVLAIGRVIWRWAQEDMAANLVSQNIWHNLKAPTPAARTRVLEIEELMAVWRATKTVGGIYGSIIRLLIITGQRRTEVAGLRWAELDRAGAMWTLPAGRAKNGVTHKVPLSELAIAEIDRIAGGVDWPANGLVMSKGANPPDNFSKALRGLGGALEVERGEPLDAWRLHDVRRTAATQFQKIGVRLEVTEAILNHVSGSRAGIAGVYQLHDWADEKRAAMDAWGQRLESLINGTDNAGGNVVSMRKRLTA